MDTILGSLHFRSVQCCGDAFAPPYMKRFMFCHSTERSSCSAAVEGDGKINCIAINPFSKYLCRCILAYKAHVNVTKWSSFAIKKEHPQVFFTKQRYKDSNLEMTESESVAASP